MKLVVQIRAKSFFGRVEPRAHCALRCVRNRAVDFLLVMYNVRSSRVCQFGVLNFDTKYVYEKKFKLSDLDSFPYQFSVKIENLLNLSTFC